MLSLYVDVTWIASSYIYGHVQHGQVVLQVFWKKKNIGNRTFIISFKLGKLVLLMKIMK